MICPRHPQRLAICRMPGFPSHVHEEHGRVYCQDCFTEALRFADAVETERIIARIRGRVRGEFGKR